MVIIFKNALTCMEIACMLASEIYQGLKDGYIKIAFEIIPIDFILCNFFMI